MPNPTTNNHTLAGLEPPALTHREAVVVFRRPFAPGAIGFRAMTKVSHNGEPYGGAQVAAYLGAQSVLQRLNAVVPGRWRQEFHPVELGQGAGKKLYLACRLIITLPTVDGGADIDAVYEDIGDMDAGSMAGLKARPGSGSSGRSSATSTSRRCAPTSTVSFTPRSSTTRSRAARSHSRRPTTTRKPACTSPGAGWKARPFSG